MNAVTPTLRTLAARLHARVVTRGRERGDLVGWILITVMTAGLIAVLWAFLGPELEQLLRQAIMRARGSMP
ncbi:hypothetical protein ABN028_11975 [Actinopolymorpha sp. B17G11]|uniref:hypothetical protein n=1 Tax=unclassified Actinopolymorpha TaxID=2627063 RepID=UPI0032D90050